MLQLKLYNIINKVTVYFRLRRYVKEYQMIPYSSNYFTHCRKEELRCDFCYTEIKWEANGTPKYKQGCGIKKQTEDIFPDTKSCQFTKLTTSHEAEKGIFPVPDSSAGALRCACQEKNCNSKQPTHSWPMAVFSS